VSSVTVIKILTYKTRTDLEVSTRNCQSTVNDVDQRLDPIKLKPGSGRIKKLKMAARSSYFPELRYRFSVHREELAVLLSALLLVHSETSG
jgi:hypothetical protein